MGRYKNIIWRPVRLAQTSFGAKALDAWMPPSVWELSEIGPRGFEPRASRCQAGALRAPRETIAITIGRALPNKKGRIRARANPLLWLPAGFSIQPPRPSQPSKLWNHTFPDLLASIAWTGAFDMNILWDSNILFESRRQAIFSIQFGSPISKTHG